MRVAKKIHLYSYLGLLMVLRLAIFDVNFPKVYAYTTVFHNDTHLKVVFKSRTIKPKTLKFTERSLEQYGSHKICVAYKFVYLVNLYIAVVKTTKPPQ